jgi:hypothetical protein
VNVGSVVTGPLPNKALQLTAKGLVPIGLRYRLASDAGASFLRGSGPLSAAERQGRWRADSFAADLNGSG